MYRRIVLKLSGEALAGDQLGKTFDQTVIRGIIEQVKVLLNDGTEVSLVIGGGNFWQR